MEQIEIKYFNNQVDIHEIDTFFIDKKNAMLVMYHNDRITRIRLAKIKKMKLISSDIQKYLEK